MGRDYTEEEKAFLSQVTASGSGLQKTSTTLSVQDERVQNSCKDNLIFDPTGMEFVILLNIIGIRDLCNIAPLSLRFDGNYI
jgi:hypothetical protein